MGQTFKFSPLLIIISVTVGGAVAGVFGMIIAIPIATVFKDIVVSITDYFEAKRATASLSLAENTEAGPVSSASEAIAINEAEKREE
jgi:predicted PurR-regulated permease PerM